jgi:flagellar assembly factor FliW
MNGLHSTMTPSNQREPAISSAVGEIPVLELVVPFQGFPDHRRFALIRLDDSGLMCALRSVDDPELRFVVVPPALFFDDYAPQIDEAVAGTLGATSEKELLVLVVVTTGDTLASATANLMAPIVVNHASRLAAQVVLDDTRLPLRAPLVRQDAPHDQHVR